MPLHRVDYVYAPRGSFLQDLALADFNAWDPGIVQAPFVSPTPGSTRIERWFRNPYVLAVPDLSSYGCLACKTPDKMTFAFALNDDDPTHEAWVFRSPNGKPIAHFSVYRDGTLLLRKTDRLGDIFRVPEGPATYRVVNTLSRVFTGSSLSTSTITDVTFRSGQGVPAPPSLYCYTGDTCSIMPVLKAHLALHASSFGAIPLGRSTFDLTVGHIEGAAQLPLASVAVKVRRTGSSTWKALAVTREGPGHYRANFKAMAWMDQRGFDVRVKVTDTKGGELIQTTDRAFVVGA
jgi:hypothetical protein